MQNHTFHEILNCSPAGSRPHQSTSFELLCPSEAFPKRAVANSFLVSTCIFLILRGSRVEQCRISAVCSPAGSRLQKSTWFELFWPSEAFPRLAVANSFFRVKLFRASPTQNQKVQGYTTKLLAAASLGKASNGQRSSNHVDFCSREPAGLQTVLILHCSARLPRRIKKCKLTRENC